VIDKSERQALLGRVHEKFGIQLLWYDNLASPGYREDVTTHGFFDTEGKLTEGLKRDIRLWVENQGWQFSRQMVKHPTVADRRIEYIYLAPMIPVPLVLGYHATRRLTFPSIRQEGLLPSVPARQTTERWDCDGNIYVCERLGTPADEGVPGSESAHWWRAHLAEKNHYGDPDWVILSVEVGNVAGARVYKDIWSKSGIIVDNVPRIPADFIRLVYPPES
jgi:hypothetical protein